MKKKLAIVFISISILLSVITFGITFNQGALRNTMVVIFYLLAVFLGVIGVVLLFTKLLDDHVLPLIEEFIEDTRDDTEDFKKGKITFVHISGLLVILVTFGFMYLSIIFRKFDAKWGPIPVVIPTLIILCVTTWYLAKSRWFNSKQGRTPPTLFIVLLIGMILAPTLGISRTENINRAKKMPTVGEYDYDSSADQALYLSTDSGMNIIDFSFGFFSDCDDDGCFWLIIIFLVVMATIILVAGSAFITHFWFLSGSIFLCGMWIIFIRELRVRPESHDSVLPDSSP